MNFNGAYFTIQLEDSDGNDFANKSASKNNLALVLNKLGIKSTSKVAVFPRATSYNMSYAGNNYLVESDSNGLIYIKRI